MLRVRPTWCSCAVYPCAACHSIPRRLDVLTAETHSSRTTHKRDMHTESAGYILNFLEVAQPEYGHKHRAIRSCYLLLGAFTWSSFHEFSICYRRQYHVYAPQCSIRVQQSKDSMVGAGVPTNRAKNFKLFIFQACTLATLAYPSPAVAA